MKSDTGSNGDQGNKLSLRLTAIFFLLSVVWILATDFAVDNLLLSGSARATAQTVKGVLFVCVTTVLVFWLSRRAFARVAADAKLALAAKTENLLNTVMANVGEAVILVGPPKRSILGCNSAVEAILGYLPEELTGKTTALIHEDVHAFDGFGRASEPILEEEGIFRCEWNLKHKDGHPVPVEITVVALHEGLGWSAGVMSIIRNLTAQKKAEAELRESEEMHRLLAENTLDIIWEMNPDLIFTYVNPAIETVTGYRTSEFVGTYLGEHVRKSELQKLQQIIQDKIAKGTAGEGVIIETELFHKDGSSIPTEAHWRGVFGNDGKLVAIQGTTRDISQRRALEAKLRQSQKLQAIGTFAGGIAHEINNPVMGISGYAQIIANAPGQTPKTQKYCSVIQKETKHIHSLIKDLLGYARTDEDMLVEPLALHEVVESTISLLRTVIRHDDIELSLRIPEDLPHFRGRRQQIQQVLMNLVTNARDALNTQYPKADEKKQLLVAGETVQRAGRNFVRLIVEDRGTGISEDIRARIFEPFFTTKPEGKGTGLGMWIVYGIVQGHNGEININSKSGEFTRFNVDLPTADGPGDGE